MSLKKKVAILKKLTKNEMNSLRSARVIGLRATRA